MRVLVIYCHPVAESFAAAAHACVIQALADGRHEVTDVDLYAEGFDPVMNRQERLDYGNTERNVRAVRKYDDQLQAAEAIVLVYPAWWHGMPAMLKGYFDRVWLPGVAFDVTPDGHVITERLRHIRRIIVVTTYGGPWWVERIVLGDSARKIVARAVRALCARHCRVDWYAYYTMDRSTPAQLGRFLARVQLACVGFRSPLSGFVISGPIWGHQDVERRMFAKPGSRRIAGYAIVSADGMLANAAGMMPSALVCPADQRFFEHGLDGVDVVVHGRHSHERQPRSHMRHRLILTRQVGTTEADPTDDKAMLWNPVGISFEDALRRLGAPSGRIGVIGGTSVFSMFLDQYDVFHLSRVRDVWLPGGQPVFSEVPALTPEAVLASHGLHPAQLQVLDAAMGVEVVSWQRAA